MKGAFFILVVLLSSIQFSCKNSGNSFSAGFLVHTLTDERWAIERDVFTAKVEELGGTVIFDNAEQDERQQYYKAKEMIENGIDVLVIVPVNSKTAASISRLCIQNKVKLIAYDIIIENSELDLFVSFDNKEIGEDMAKYAIKNNPSGNYVLFWGDSNMRIAHWIQEGQMEVLKPYIDSKKISVLYKAYIESWSDKNATQLMKKIISFSDTSIDVVLASSDGIAAGVIEAFDGVKNIKRPLLTGQDASQIALGYIKKGKQSMTIQKSFNELAELAATNAYDLAMGNAIEPDTVLFNGRLNIPSILLHTKVIDSSNLNN